MFVGKLFYVDFGFIFGRDFKFFFLLMKLIIEMIDGMGGLNFEYFYDFKKLCYIVFFVIRRLFKIDDFYKSVYYKY